MTVVEFLDRLAATPREWTLTPGGRIRRRVTRCLLASAPHDHCPLQEFDADLYLGQVLLRGVPQSGAIIRAADNREAHDPKIRAALLAACGLGG